MHKYSNNKSNGKQPQNLRDQETSPVISSSRSRSGSSSRSKKIPTQKVANPFLVDLDDGEDDNLINAADFLDQPSRDEGSVFKRLREGSSKGEKEKGGSERFSKIEQARESTLGGLTESDFGTDDLFCVLNSQTNKPGNGDAEEKEKQKNAQGRLGEESNQKLGWNAVDDEEDMFASTPEADKNDNDQQHHLSEGGNIESNWGSDGHNLDSGLNDVELVNKKGGDTLHRVGLVSNSGDTLGRAEKEKGKAHADDAKEGGERVKKKDPSSSTSRQEGGERVKGSRRFHQKVVPVNRSAKEKVVPVNLSATATARESTSSDLVSISYTLSYATSVLMFEFVLSFAWQGLPFNGEFRKITSAVSG